jgi:hypothetical protein
VLIYVGNDADILSNMASFRLLVGGHMADMIGQPADPSRHRLNAVFTCLNMQACGLFQPFPDLHKGQTVQPSLFHLVA